MNKPTDRARSMEHGDQCECAVLARTLMIDPNTIPFEFCVRVLQRHWRMTCLHGSRKEPAAATGSGERWQGVGPVDAVRAILIGNDSGER